LKKGILIILLVLFYVGVVSVSAKPFVVCDPQVDVEEYVLVLNDGSEIVTPAPLKYDLADLLPGQYVLVAYAKNGVWRSDASVPLDFTKPLLIQPVIRLSE